MSKPAGSAARPSAASTTIAATSRSRRGDWSASPDAAQRASGALPIRAIFQLGMVPGLAEQREECCTATGTRNVNHRRVVCRPRGMLRMDMMSMVSGILAAQAGNVQMQVAATIMKSNADAEKSAVLTLLGAGGQSVSSFANGGPGIGGNLDVTA